jgi:glycosyltransferase involved in cell wall biosynthesis
VAYAPNGVDTSQFSPSVLPLSPKGNKVRVLIEGPGGIDFKRVDDAFRMTDGIDSIEIWYVCSDGITKPNWKYDRIFNTVPFKQMPSIYRSCDILLKVSAVEGFFGPPLEMMACGGTCIVSNVTGHDEYVIDKENALIINIGDIEAGKHALTLLVTDTNLRLKLSKNGILTSQKFDWAIQHPKFETALLELFHDETLDSKPLLNRITLLSQIRNATENARLLAREMERPRYKIAKWIFDKIALCFPSFCFTFGSLIIKRFVHKQKLPADDDAI